MQHSRLLNIVLMELKEFSVDNTKPIRVLDLGCGWGGLLLELQQFLSDRLGTQAFEVHGLEVGCHRAAVDDYRTKLANRLQKKSPGLSWSERIHVVETGEDHFPFDDGFFDVIVSNQVLEHVSNHKISFQEQYRVLSTSGKAIHIYPSKERWIDGHLNLPLVHRIEDFDRCKKYIELMSALGFGKWKGTYKQEKVDRGFSLNEYANYQAEYMNYQTNFLFVSEVLKLTKNVGFKSSFKYTVINRRIAQLFVFSSDNLPFWLQYLHFWLVCRLGSVTLLLDKSRLQRYGTFVVEGAG